jgi:DNA-directed RNA polymerase specialized sigma24 family protein
VAEPSPPEPQAPDPTASPQAPDPTASRDAIDRLMRAHGADVHRYCVAMLGWEGAAAMLPTIFGHLQEHAVELEPGAERLVALAVAHNRCIERSRTGGRPPPGQGLPEQSARVVRAMAQLQPVGRDAVVLRSFLGLRWPELERVCGLPAERMLQRTCRAWRNAIEAAAGRPVGPRQRPAGRRLDETPARWEAIRDDARRFVALRHALRQVLEGYGPPDGWQAEVWLRLEQEREDQRRLASERALERAAAEAARAARAAAAAAAAAEPSGGAFTGAVDEDQAEDPAPPARARSWRWLTVGVLLALVGLAARWLLLP